MKESDEHVQYRTEALQEAKKQETLFKNFLKGCGKTNVATTDNHISFIFPRHKHSLKIRSASNYVHATMAKAESSLPTQFRTEKIGFAALLHQRKVPGKLMAVCQKGWPRQTAKHVIMFCRPNDVKNRSLTFESRPVIIDY